MTRFTRSLVCLLLLGLTTKTDAQPQRYRVERFGHGIGQLPGSPLRLLQDRQGYLWIATFNGLARYDGYGFTVFQPDPDDPEASILNLGVRMLHEDRSGGLWIGTWTWQIGLLHGLSRYDPATGRFRQFAPDPNDPRTLSTNPGISSGPNDMLEDRAGRLWIAHSNGKFDRLDPETAVVTRFGSDTGRPGALSAPIHQLDYDPLSRILEDRAGRLWVGTWGGGLNLFDVERDAFTAFRHDPGNPASLSNDFVYAIYEAPSEPGVIWVGTRGGLDRLDLSADTPGPGSGQPGGSVETGRFTHLVHDAADPTTLSGPRVRALHEDREGRLWVRTEGGGLDLFDRETGRFQRVLSEPVGSGFSGIVEGSDGGIWIAARGRVLQVDPHTGESNRYGQGDTLNVSDLLVDRFGTVWATRTLGHVGELLKLSPGGGIFRNFRHDPTDPTSLANPAVESVLESPDGTLWIGTPGTLHRLDGATGAMERFPLRIGNIRAMEEDASGFLWLAGGQGLYRFDPRSETSTLVRQGWVQEVYVDRVGMLWAHTGNGLLNLDPETSASRFYTADPANPDSLPGGLVRAVFEDASGALWVRSASDGEYPQAYLSRFEPSEERTGGQLAAGRFVSFPERGMSYARPHLDRQGTLWYPGYEDGLYRFDAANERLIPFVSTKDGMSDNSVEAILDDELGRLWVSTRNGLNRIDLTTGKIRVFDTSDGLASNQFFISAFRLRSGELVFGGPNGFSLFDPSKIVDDPRPPSVVLTGLRLFDAPVAVGIDGPLPSALDHVGEVRLGHWQNDVTIEYVGLHLARPERIRYRYRLEGFEDAWREVGDLRRAVYPNLPHGEYTFRVTAANPDGVWSTDGASVGIVVLPPWWRTRWAYGLYGMLIVAGIFAVDRFQRRRLIARERQRAAIEQERLRAEAAERELEQAREIERAHAELQQAHEHLKTTQAQLVQQEKLASLGQLTAGISHEIKNPLNFINNFAELNQELVDELREAWHSGGADVEAILDDLKRNEQVVAQHGKRADAIVRAMMQHASGGSGEREVVDLNALVDEYIDLAYHGKRAQVPDFSVEVIRAFGFDASSGSGDRVGEVEVVPQEIGRVLLNLLSNAFDAVEGLDEPRVTVSTRRSGPAEAGHAPRVEIRVSDNGPGIAPETRERIFEPFFTTKPTGSGTGLGLSLSYDIVTQGHGGSLEVEDTEGAGTTFLVSLPSLHSQEQPRA